MSTNLYKIEDIPVPLKLIIERRNTATVSITPRNVIIRLPQHLDVEERQKILDRHLTWARQTIEQKKIFTSFKQSISEYQDAQITIYNTIFSIKVLQSVTSKNKLRYIGNYQIEIHLLKEDINQNNVALIKKFLVKFTNKLFLNKIINKTIKLNDLHFDEPIKEIKLKYSTSKWGACYPDKTIVFSTKLLLLPDEIIDYVIIHELAHLKEMNHSKRFWDLVKKAMPNYKKHVQWLKKHQNEFDF